MPPLGHSEVLWNSLTSKGNRIKLPLYSSKEVPPNSLMCHYYCMRVSCHTGLLLCSLSLGGTLHTMSFTERGPWQRGRRKYLLGHSQDSLMQGDITARCGYFTTSASGLLFSPLFCLCGGRFRTWPFKRKH